MKALMIVGTLLIILGTFALAYQGITYVTRETVVDVGPVHVEAARERTLWFPPVASAVMLGMGILLVVAGLLDRRRWT